MSTYIYEAFIKRANEDKERAAKLAASGKTEVLEKVKKKKYTLEDE